MNTRYDLLIPGRHLGMSEYVELGQRAQTQGWTGVWVSEVLSVDAFSLLGAIAQGTKGLDLGTAIVPIATRSAPLLAMGAYTLSQLTTGDFFLGVGVSTESIMAERHDRRIERPLAEMRATVEIVRRALAGDRVTLEGTKPTVSNFRLPIKTSSGVQVGVAAVGPKMLELARESSDAVLLNLVTAEQAKEHAKAAPQGRDPTFQTIAVYRTAVDPTEDDITSIRREAASYCRVKVYRKALEASGWDIQETAEAATLEDAAKIVPDEFVDSVVLTGSAATCRDRLSSLREAGVRPLVLPVADRHNLGDMSRRIIDRLGG